MIEVGQQAPDFTLYNTKKEEVGLSAQKGKTVLLLFFPLAFTGVCTEELCSIRDGISFYNDSDAQVFGISVDSLFTLEKFAEEQKLNFPLLSDFNADVARSYNCCYDDFVLGMKNVAKRSAFVIDGKGIVQYAEVLESAGDLPNFEEIQKAISSLH